MENSSLNSELFGATNLFDNVTKNFKEGVELKNHNRRLKCYRNSFIASKGVDFMFNLLKTKKEFSNKVHHRDQAINLMNIFLKWGIIIKLYPTSNSFKFQDNNKDLYTLGKSEDDGGKVQIVKSEPVYEAISKSTNDLICNNSVNNNLSFRANQSVYRSFSKSTYSQIQNTIKKTTSTIMKSTNHNVTKFTNQTLNKFNNKSSNNLIKKFNSNLVNKSNRMLNKLNSNLNSNLIKRSTSAQSKNNSASINRPFTRSNSKRSIDLDKQFDKENLIINNDKKFERNYRGHLSLNKNFNSNQINSSTVNNFPTARRRVNSLSLNSQPFNLASPINQAKLSTSLNMPNNYSANIDHCLTFKTIETEGNNLIKFLTKLSDGLMKKPLKPVNNSLSLESSMSSINNPQIILNRNTVQYRPIIMNEFEQTKCLMTPYGSTCYNTLV